MRHQHRQVLPWLLMGALLCLVPGAAQEGRGQESPPKKKTATVTVEVKDKVSAEPVIGADIFVSVDGTGYEESTSSDDTGKAEFKDIPKGRATIQATKPGFKTAGQSLDLDEHTRTIAMRMEKKN